ncbi:flagellin N-terminal helical domain-containing protein [Halomonas sp. BC1]|uniref:flagellin N-terminal helical domain-containing protein n=1 Tax=Halomonas sp. BC1 TaxID=1670448 RepID=UPI0009BCBAE2|nr:flagellin [Halomonas sp. BC1]
MSVINTNITSLIGQSNLSKSQNALQTSMERLSSGLRINSAKDDAAGQAIANRMTAQINGLNQAQRNANDGISLVQTAEGALNQINDNVQRIRELTVQAANGTNSEEDLKSIQDEITQRLEEIDRIANQTTFNGVEVLAPGTDSINIQVGANDGEFITVNLEAADAAALGLAGFTVVDADFDSETDGPLALIDEALNIIDSLRSELGAVQNRFEDAIVNLNTNSTNLSAARSRIEDADYAVEVANMTRAQILQQAGTSVLAQANQIPQNVLSLLG